MTAAGPRGRTTAGPDTQFERLERHRPALWLALLAAGIYLWIAGDMRLRYEQTPFAHHIYLADALLHGQTYLRDVALERLQARGVEYADRAIERYSGESGVREPPSSATRQAVIERWWNSIGRLDWTIVEGRFYGYWAPLLPVASIPFVALGGLDASDRLLSAVFGALNVGLFYCFLERLDRSRLLLTSAGARVALTTLLAFGTVHFYSACHGGVWFSAQLVSLTALLGACWAVAAPANRSRHALACGAWFAAAVLGRNVVAAMGLFFVAVILLRTPRAGKHRWRAAGIRLGLWGLPCLAAAGLQLLYNQARFGSAWETGQTRLILESGDPRFREDFVRYGQFHPHFLRRNAWHYFLNWRFPSGPDGRQSFDADGNSRVGVTPPLLYALLAWRQRSWLVLAAVAGVVPFLAALLLFRATGFIQFGNRYLLEVLPLLLLLVAAGMRGRLSWVSYTLVASAVAIQTWGARLMLPQSFALVESLLSWTVYPAGVALAVVLRPLLASPLRTAATPNS